MGPEKRIENQIKAMLDRTPECWFMKVHGSAFQKAGVPDLLGCCRGRSFALEVKVPGEHPTPIQEHEMGLLRRSGAIVAVVTSLEEARAVIEAIP